MTKPLLIAIIILLAACKSPLLKPDQFKLSGEVSGYKDNTMLYLENGEHLDSALLIHGKFQFTGILGRKADHLLLKTKEATDYKFIWAERTEMQLSGEKGQLRLAKISGSKTQFLDDELDSVCSPFYKREIALNKETNLNNDAKAKMSKALEDKADSVNMIFVEKHPDCILSADFLAGADSRLGRQKTKRLYTLLSAEMKNTTEGKSALKYITYNKDIQIGKPFADFTQYDPDGKPVKLSDFAGHVILLDFWASWCHPCRGENPNQVKNYILYKDKGFKIVAVSVDELKKNWITAIKDDGLNYTNVSEKNGGNNTAELVYGVLEYPTTYLIDKNGIIIAKDLRGEELSKKLKQLFK